MADLNVNSIGDASGGNTTTINTFTPTVSNMAGRNRIINGDMRIDARNAGASVAIPNGTVVFITDRFRFDENTDGSFSGQQVTDAPSGFVNSLKLTVTSADASLDAGQYSNLRQFIEGFNVADLGWGTANAQSATLSFWVKSSLTGTFGGSLRSSTSDLSYPFTYAISSANTWEFKTITVAGPTTGTWYTDNSLGLGVIWGLGVGSTYSGTAGSWQSSNLLSATGATSVVGTNGATFYITGVQLEAGSVATPFEHRPYGQELALAQRYYQIKNWYEAASQATAIPLSPDMRASPTVTFSNLGWGGTPNSVFGASLNWIGVTGAAPVWSAMCSCSSEL